MGTRERGAAAERLVARRLRLRGWRILGRNVRVGGVEVDLIAVRGGTLALVEVKARRRPHPSAPPVGIEQRRRLGRAAAALVAGRPELAGLDARLDVVVVSGAWPRRRVHHLVDAREDEGLPPLRRGRPRS